MTMHSPRRRYAAKLTLMADVCGVPGRDTFHQFHQGMPDGELVAALLKAATGPPPKVLAVETASVQDAPLPLFPSRRARGKGDRRL